MIAGPSVEREATLTEAPSGLLARLAFRVVDPPSGTVVVLTTSTGISETIGGQGLSYYTKTFTTPAVRGEYMIEWLEDGEVIAGEALEVSWSNEYAPTVHYAEPDELRDVLGLTEDVLPDKRALRLIRDAEDTIDRLLGASILPDETTGRKILEADVEAWQWEKLRRATVAVAELLHSNPELARGQQWRSVSGPDFSFAGPQGATVGAQVIALLDDSGLRRLATRAVAGPGRMRADYDRFLKATRHNGT